MTSVTKRAEFALAPDVGYPIRTWTERQLLADSGHSR
jgi:hypothetical protein